MQVHAIGVPALPGGASMIVDDQPGSVIIWYLDELPPEEVARLLARVWQHNARRGHWARQQELLSA